DPRVDGHVVHALLGLLEDRVPEQLPGEGLGLAVDLLQRLVDGHGADGDGAVADDPLSGAELSLWPSWAAEEVTAEVPMLALTLVRNRLPMTMGSVSGWLTLAGRMARPPAPSPPTTSGAT